MSRLVREERGQALVEFAFVAPLLVLTLAGIVYCGTLVVTQEHMAVASRHVARSQALQATKDAMRTGKSAPAKASTRQSALGETPLGGRGVTVTGLNWGTLKSLSRGSGTLKSLDRHTALLYKQKSLRLKNGKSYEFGIGVVYHGATVKRDLRDLSALGKMFGAFQPSISATSVMPQELAPRGEKGSGILDLNGWITRILEEDVK